MIKILEDPPIQSLDRKPWYLEILLYPASWDGITYIVVFILLRLLLNFSYRILLSRLYFGILIYSSLFLFLVGYVLYYIGYCIFDSSKGGVNAPPMLDQKVDKYDLLVQIIYFLGSLAICFWPAATYFAITMDINWKFWFLFTVGTFFFPISILRAALFDELDALNPVKIIKSVKNALLPYCRLILILIAFTFLIVFINWLTEIIAFLGLFSIALNICLLLIFAHILGRFYWYHKYKLNWGV